MGAPWVVLSRAGGGCSPREPVCVSLPWVHAKEVTQNSPHHRLSRSCISKRSKIVVERCQIPSFVPAREPGHTPRILLSSTLGVSALLGSLNVSKCIVGCRWYTGARVGRAQAPLFARDERRNWEEIHRVSARVDVLHTAIHGAKRGITAPVCTCQVPLAACHPCTSLVPEAQHPLVEGERFLDVAVPVLPGVRAGALGVFVGDAELLKVAMESAVFL